MAAEVSYERVSVFERQTLLNMLATAVNESARNQAANEAIIARVREVEQELTDADRIRQQLQEAQTATQRDYEQCIREREALAEKVGQKNEELKALATSYDILQAAHRQEHDERRRLEDLVRTMGGDPTPPIDDDGGPEEDAREDTDRVDDEGAADDGPDDPRPGTTGSVRER